MGIPVLILGESGTGKSASLRNFEASDLKVINVANKPLPFKNKFECVASDDYRAIVKELKLNKKKVSVIDDAQYLMANEFMRRATERGFDKFTEIAQNFWSLVNMVKDLPNDHVVYFLAHIERDANGFEKIKTIGKLLDEKITVEGMFTIVLKTNVTDGQYSFLTQNSGHDTVKSPIGMFPSYAIDNDLKYVDEKIRNYYEIGEFLTDEEMAEIDEEAKKDDIPIADGKKKRGRRSEKKEEPAEAPAEEKKEETSRTRKRRGAKTEDVPETDGDNNDDQSDESGSVDADEEPTDSGDDAASEPVPRRSRKARKQEESDAASEPVPRRSRKARKQEESDEASEPVPRRSRKARKQEESDEAFMKDAPAEGEDTEVPFEESTPAEAPAATSRRRRRR